MKKLVSLVLALTMVLSIFTIVPFSASADTGNTVYLINSANWSNVHAYTWTTNGGESAAWPGNLMTNTGQKSSNGADIYSITVDSAYDNIIFNCGNDSAKTADLKTQLGGYYDNSSMSWVNDNPTPNPNPTPGDTMTIYFQNNWMWTDVKVYYWGSSSTNSATWPGDTPQLAGNDGTYDVYSATVPTDITGIIFNGFDGGINANNQTPDILTAADGDCYSMEWNATENKNNVVRSDINNILPINPTDAPTQAPTQAPTDAPTQAPTVEPTEAPVDGLFVRIDGKTYEVKKGDVVNYTYKLSVADVKISSLDIEMNYDNDGLQFMPYTDEYGENDLVKQFPVINGGVVQNYDYADADGIIYYNFSSVAGLRFNDSIMFTGQFKVTADKGIYDISSKVNTMADSDLNKIVYNFEKYGDYTEAEVVGDLQPIEPTDAPTDAPTQAPQTQAPQTQAPQTQAPQPTQNPEDEGLYVKADGKYFPVVKGQTYTYQYCLSVDPSIKISSLDINMNFDKDGLKFVPYTDKYGDVDLNKHFPVISGGVVQNYTMADSQGLIFYNYSNVAGIRMADNTVIFTGDFTVTADKGTYEIVSKVNTMADSNLNKIVYNFEVFGEYGESASVLDVEPVTPTNGPQPTQAPTTAPQPTAAPTQAPTQAPQPTQNPEDEGLYVKADGKYFPVVKGQTYTYQYCLSVDPSIKISSLDINMNFDKDGLKFVPYTDKYGDVDLNKHFPVISGGVVQNYTMADSQGLIFYNYSNVAGIRMADNTVIFTGDFTVTADKGTYEIVSKVNTMADSNLNKIVYNFEVFGEYGESASVLDVEPVTPTNAPQPTQAPTQAPTTAPQPTQEPDKGLFVRVDGKLYEVEKGQKFTYQYCLSVDEAIKISSLDVRTMFDQEGLKFNPYTDKYGDNDLAKQYPNISGGVVCNYNFAETEGILYYNYSNVAGIRMANDTVIFVGEFEVTADEGIYNLSSIVNTMADSNGNKLVYEGEVFSEYGDKEIVDLKPYEPTEKPTEEPTTPPVDPTYPEGLFVEIDRTLYEVEKDKEYTFTYYFQLEGKRVGSLDARVEYDTEGLDLIPTLDADGYEDTLKMFPILMSPTYNFEHDGKIYINDTKIPNGVNFPSQTSVLFTVKFKVTADEGVYKINPYIYNLADTQLNKIVNEGYVIGEYYDKGVLDAPIYDGNDNPDILMGDVNLDGEVSVFDVSEIQRYAAAYCDLNELQLTVGDVNYDGIVNVFDASEIQRYIAGFITEFVKPNA